MAEIPIERKSGSGWIVWLILLALAALLVWWLIGRGDDSRVAAGDIAADTAATAPATVPAPAPIVGDEAGAVVSDLSEITGASDADALVGRRVQLSSVQVQEVVSDRGFWIGAGEDDRVFAVRTAQNSPATPPDGAINPGQTVSLQGVLRAMPSNLEEQRTPWNLESTDVSRLSGQTFYIEVDSISILERS